jgi:hypothetical protein
MSEKMRTQIAKMRTEMFERVVINAIGIFVIVAIVVIAFKVIPA